MEKIKVLKEAIKILKKQVGKRCKDYCYGCFICDTYVAIAIMEHWIDIEKSV